jgi:ParB family chromosome partitioning protein
MVPLKDIIPKSYGIRESQGRNVKLDSNVRRVGVLQPIMLRRKGEKFEIIFGNGRYENAVRAKHKEILAIIVDCDEKEALLRHISENMVRQNYNPLEESRAFELLKRDIGWSAREIALFLGHTKQKSVIADRMALSKMPETVKELVKSEKLTVQHATLLRSKVPKQFQEQEAKNIAEREMTVEETRAYLAIKEPIYSIHRNEKPPQPSSAAAPEKLLGSPIKIADLTLTGFLQGEPASFTIKTTGGKETVVVNAIQDFILKKAKTGDRVDLTVTIWEPPKKVAPLEAS